MSLTPNSSLVLKPVADCKSVNICSLLSVLGTHEFPPPASNVSNNAHIPQIFVCLRFSHVLWDGILDVFDVLCSKTSGSSLVLWASKAGANRCSHKGRDMRTRRGLALSGLPSGDRGDLSHVGLEKVKAKM